MCKYCEKSKSLEIKDAYGDLDLRIEEIYVEDKHLGIDTISHRNYIDINYCPMCGRKLED